MKIVVASRNPVKLRAAREAFAMQFPAADPEVVPVGVPSGVADQPASDAETRRGARNRVAAARHAAPDGDFWVGFEGGVEVIDDRLMGFAWVAVQGPAGSTGLARSTTLPLPPAVRRLVDSGMELGEANDEVFATVNSKQGGGAYGLLTGGLYTRTGIYSQTLVIALIPLVHELFPRG